MLSASSTVMPGRTGDVFTIPELCGTREHAAAPIIPTTKVVGTTSAVMQLVESGRIALDAPVQRYLPAWTGRNKEKVTIRHLLTHTSGLPSFKPYDTLTTDPDSIAKLMFATPLDTTP